MKKITFLLIISLFALLLSGCNGDTSALVSSKPESEATSTPATTETPSTEAPTETDPPAEENSDYSEVYAKYLEILLGNKEHIERYTWQQGGGSIAFADIVDDPTPELIYLWVADGGNSAALNGCVYRDGEVSLIYYAHVLDELVGSGVRYCFFRTTDYKLYLYKSQGEDPWIYSFTEYSVDPINGYVPEVTLVHEESPSADHTTSTHKYTLDGVEITESGYNSYTQEIIDKIGSVIVWSGQEEGQPIWDKVSKMESLSMTYDEAIAFLKANITSVDTPSAPSTSVPPAASAGEFTEDQAIALMPALIMAEWPQAQLNESSIASWTTYTVAKSDKLYDDQPIYVVDYSVLRTGTGRALAFADGTLISQQDPSYANYNGYFDIDITAYWPFD
ncbi:MAG: hypothetical protein ACK5MU_03300 [Candidatus Saccharimonadales bacterium]